MSFVNIFVDAFKKAAAKRATDAKQAIDSGSAGTLGSTTQTGGAGFEPLSRPAPEPPPGPQPGGSELEAASSPPAGAPIPYPNVPDAPAAADVSSAGDYKVEGEPMAFATGEVKDEAIGPGGVTSEGAREAPEGSEYFEVKVEDVVVSSSAGADQEWDLQGEVKLAALEGIKGESTDAKHEEDFLALARESGDPEEVEVEDMAGRFKIDIKGEARDDVHKVEAVGVARESSGLMEEEGIKEEAIGLARESIDPDKVGGYHVEDTAAGFKVDIKGESTDAKHEEGFLAPAGDSSDQQEGGEYKVEATEVKDSHDRFALAGSDPEESGEHRVEGGAALFNNDAALDGESHDAKHAGLSTEGEPAEAGEPSPDAVASRASMQDIHFVSQVNKASPSLMTSDAEEAGEPPVAGAAEDFDVKIEDVRGDDQGEGLGGADIEALARKAGGDQLEYLKVKMEDVIVTSAAPRAPVDDGPAVSTLVDLQAAPGDDGLLSLAGEAVEGDELVVIADVELDSDAGMDEIEV